MPVRAALILMFIACSLGNYTHATELVLQSGFGEVTPSLEFYLDTRTDPSSDIDDIRSQQFLNVSDNPPQFGYTSATVWLRLRYVSDVPGTWLSVNYPLLDELDIYILRDGQMLSQYRMGDRLAFDQRLLMRPDYTVPLPVTETPADVYLRVRSDSSVEVPVTIVEDYALRHQMESSAWTQGLFFGAMVMLGLYHVLIFFSSGDRSYLYFGGLSLTMAFIQITIWGRSYQFLWPDSPDWNSIAISTLINASNFFGILYISKLVKIREHYRLIHIAAMTVATVAALQCFVSIFVTYGQIIQSTLLLSLVTFVLGSMMIILRMRDRYPPAFAAFIAGLMYALGSFSYILGKLGVLENGLFLDNALAIGQLLQVLLFAFALSIRMAMDRELRERAQRETEEAKDMLLETERHQNVRLDQEVRARTRELEAANLRLEKISATDALTGLYNRRHFDETFEREYYRAAREHQPLSLIMLDLDHFKKLNDSYGHTFGDEALRQTAIRIQDVLNRPGDVAFRYGGEEFVILLPDTPPSAAHILARQIWSAMRSEPVSMKDQAVKLTISIGIASEQPAHGGNCSALLNKADQKLYQAKEEGRDRICN